MMFLSLDSLCERANISDAEFVIAFSLCRRAGKPPLSVR